eukprot:jgi/Mesvir1/20478/Mv12365-RA.1
MGRSGPCHKRNCDKKGDKSCGRCRSVYYCSKECQTADFPDHKAACKSGHAKPRSTTLQGGSKGPSTGNSTKNDAQLTGDSPECLTEKEVPLAVDMPTVLAEEDARLVEDLSEGMAGKDVYATDELPTALAHLASRGLPAASSSTGSTAQEIRKYVAAATLELETTFAVPGETFADASDAVPPSHASSVEPHHDSSAASSDTFKNVNVIKNIASSDVSKYVSASKVSSPIKDSMVKDSAPIKDTAMGDSAFMHIVGLCQMGSKYGPLLTDAGAGDLLATALEWSLAGRSRVPLSYVCAGIDGLALTSDSSCLALGKRGVVAHLTKALVRATRDRDWSLVNGINLCLSSLATEPSHCAAFASAGTLIAVEGSIIAGIRDTASRDAPNASYAGCTCFRRLHLVCNHDDCKQKRHRGTSPGLLPALHACLDRVLAPRQGPVSPTLLSWVSGALLVVASFPQFAHNMAATVATPGACKNLVRALAVATSPRHLPERGSTNNAPEQHGGASIRERGGTTTIPEQGGGRLQIPETVRVLSMTLCRTLSLFCGADTSTMPRQLSRAGPHVAKLLRAANEAGDPWVREEACLAMRAVAMDPAGNRWLFDEGVVKELLDMIRVGMRRGDLEHCAAANGTLAMLCDDVEGGRRLGAMAKDISKLLVDCFELLLAAAVRQEAVGGKSCTQHMFALVVFWAKMGVVNQASAGHFAAAGADGALTRGIQVAVDEGNLTAARCFRLYMERFLLPHVVAKATR